MVDDGRMPTKAEGPQPLLNPRWDEKNIYVSSSSIQSVVSLAEK